MLIIQIAMGIVLAALILRYLPQILGLAIGAAGLALVLGLLAGCVALLINFPQIIYFSGIFIGLSFLIVLADYASHFIQRHYEALPSWLKVTIERARTIDWTRLLFCTFLAIFASIPLLIAFGLIVGSSKLIDGLPSWVWTTGYVVLLGTLTWLIYNLPWASKLSHHKNEPPSP